MSAYGTRIITIVTLALAANASATVTAGALPPTTASVAAPVVLYTDLVSGPNLGGEHDKGTYLSVFGKNFSGGNLGTSTRIYIGGTEVDNYRYLGPSRG